MKNIFFLIVIIIATALPSRAETNHLSSIENNKLIIKFRPGTELANSWLQSDRIGQIDELISIIGKHQTKPYIGSSTLKSLSKCYADKLSRGYYSPVESLSRICVVKFAEPRDIYSLVARLSLLKDIEYAEPASRNVLSYYPSDTLFYKQYYIPQIKADSAWSLIDTTNLADVLIGIVDTGVDYLHDDLAANIWQNPGESGLDKDGKDKRTNGIDDDNNGFIDDWHGWDFVSSSASGQDNDPLPGHPHGTHVSGTADAVTNNITGIAGIAVKTKILPVKIGADSPFSTSVDNAYEGVLYAATMGAKAINCSWGSSNKSESDAEVLTTATELGALICAAAGNDGSNISFYPSAHEKCLSVAAVGWNDVLAYFSNYHSSVGISAPGIDIFATIPNNDYESMDGTSMATPIVTGVAALVRLTQPQLTPVQVKEYLKASSDNIDSLNPMYIGKMGRGRVNALNAVQKRILKSLILKSYTVTESSGDGLYDVGDTLTVNMSIQNILAPLKNSYVQIISRSLYEPAFINNSSTFGDLATMEEKAAPAPIVFVVPAGIPPNFIMDLEFRFFDDSGYINSDYMQLTFRPTYRTMSSNNITATFNSRGNIGYNDYPSNNQGSGFRYKNSKSLLYEGALMLALAPDKVSDVARGFNQMEQSNSFITDSIIKTIKPGKLAAEEGSTSFKTITSPDEVGVYVSNHIYQFNDSLRKDYVYVVYDIVNTSGADFDSLYAGLYFDWDIGPSGSNNYTNFDNSDGFGIVRNVNDTSLPWVGVSMLSNHALNYFAIDNDGATDDNPGVWDGFERTEKYRMLTSGISRKESNITDISMVIGAGPIKLKNADTTRVTFALFCSDNYNNLLNTEKNARENALKTGLADGIYNPLPNKDTIYIIYPNPTFNYLITCKIGLVEGSYITIDIIDMYGKTIKNIVNQKYYVAGTHEFNKKLDYMSQGNYFIRLKTNKSMVAEQFEVTK